MPDNEPPNPDEVRRQLIALVGRKGKRKQEWTKERPTDWRPAEVYDPEWKVCLTAPAAWELILTWLEQGRPIETKQMTLASNETVWVHIMVEQLGKQMIYVKLQILGGGNFVFGWSFHLSERTAPDS